MVNYANIHGHLDAPSRTPLGEEEDIRPRLQVRITGPRRLLPRCARQPAVKKYRGRKYVHWNGGLQVWSKEVRSPVGVVSCVRSVVV
jgi:hypothetical protein